jgi:3-hydroxyacyl-[acyl-carrier-protein] dehydratase
MNDQPASAAATQLDIRRVMAALPHRYPMLLVDRVEALDPGRSTSLSSRAISPAGRSCRAF